MKIINYLYKSKVGIFVRKIINSFRFFLWIYRHVANSDKKRIHDAKIWKVGEHYKTEQYNLIDASGAKFLKFIEKVTLPTDRILDICCNQGRFLFSLKKNGYSKLYGFDIMDSAIHSIKNNKEFNESSMNIEHCLAQDYFEDKHSNQFDWAITYSATIELIHPEFDIFSELSRTVKKGMIFVLNESGHTYPRFYRYLHAKHGFKIISTTPILKECVLIYSIKV